MWLIVHYSKSFNRFCTICNYFASCGSFAWNSLLTWLITSWKSPLMASCLTPNPWPPQLSILHIQPSCWVQSIRIVPSWFHALLKRWFLHHSYSSFTIIGDNSITKPINTWSFISLQGLYSMMSLNSPRTKLSFFLLALAFLDWVLDPRSGSKNTIKAVKLW